MLAKIRQGYEGTRKGGALGLEVIVQRSRLVLGSSGERAPVSMETSPTTLS
jgi:hypothetical protein